MQLARFLALLIALLFALLGARGDEESCDSNTKLQAQPKDPIIIWWTTMGGLEVSLMNQNRICFEAISSSLCPVSSSDSNWVDGVVLGANIPQHRGLYKVQVPRYYEQGILE